MEYTSLHKYSVQIPGVLGSAGSSEQAAELVRGKREPPPPSALEEHLVLEHLEHLEHSVSECGQ